MNIPRSEHPRPQMERSDWRCLNGEWAFAFDFSCSGRQRGMALSDDYPLKITVPFCPESALSGIGFTDFIPACWYRRTFHLSKEELAGRVLLHFGAVDCTAYVYVNGREAGSHRGGYTSFVLDITEFTTAGENVLCVCAEDDVRSGLQTCGKQSTDFASHGCFYTRTTGIWQTVWLEFVPKNYIKSLRLLPDAINGAIQVEAELENAHDAKLVVNVALDGQHVAEKTVRCASHTVCCTLDIPNPQLWSPDAPVLYQMELNLYSGEGTDHVHSYFGLRTVEWHDRKFYLNGKPLFMRLILDQGFYPDGVYTAPTEDALIHDIELAKSLGFNGARMHEKVFEERWLYHADRLGYLAWGEFGSWGLDVTTARGLELFLPEWMECVKRDFNHPAIIGWCPLNETFDIPLDAGRHAQDDEVIRQIYLVTKALDPSRPVIDVSGFYHVQTDIYDLHDYEQVPQVFSDHFTQMQVGDRLYDEKDSRQHYDWKTPLFMSEYGGTFWKADENARRKQDAAWKRWKDPESEQEVIDRYVGLTTVLLKSLHFCGFCYTQLTDVEQETNGLFTYDRGQKFSQESLKRIREANLQRAAMEEE